jgi:hypothetical protein
MLLFFQENWLNIKEFDLGQRLMCTYLWMDGVSSCACVFPWQSAHCCSKTVRENAQGKFFGTWVKTVFGSHCGHQALLAYATFYALDAFLT